MPVKQKEMKKALGGDTNTARWL